MNGQLHCGACQKDMESSDELNEHLKTCEAARAFILPVTALLMGAPDPSHSAAHVIYATSRHAGYIREYARAVADEIPSLQRAEIHARLCDKLGLEYSEFKPFEADDIDAVPTVQEAEGMIWEALGRYVRPKMFMRASGERVGPDGQLEWVPVPGSVSRET